MLFRSARAQLELFTSSHDQTPHEETVRNQLQCLFDEISWYVKYELEVRVKNVLHKIVQKYFSVLMYISYIW